ncbi:MAG: Fe-S cluster assembly scaffold IscU [Bacteroidetes bacterium HLUCCA01]|nr:MAG: Fe-S cluster assembly scaffold IscU [Bacteroidetes bacterium HLUCCA01]
MKSYDDILIHHAKNPVHAVEKGFRAPWEGQTQDVQGSADDLSIAHEPVDVWAGTPGSQPPADQKTGQIEHRNRSCGDVVRLWWRSENGVITHIFHNASGCMLCKASASVLCEVVQGVEAARIPELVRSVERLTDREEELTEEAIPGFPESANRDAGSFQDATDEQARTQPNPTNEAGGREQNPAGTSPAARQATRAQSMQALSQVREFPTRRKCITLAWEALEASISDER